MKRIFIHNSITLWSVALLISLLCVSCGSGELKVKSKDLEITLSKDGEILKAFFPEKNLEKAIEGSTLLQDCEVISVESSKIANGSVQFVKSMKNSVNGATFSVTETFTPTNSSINWAIKIEGSGDYWSTPISTELKYPADQNVTHWLSWADPRGDISGGGTDNALIANAIINSGDLSDFNSWVDPLVDLPLRDAKWHYGAPRYEYDNPGILYCPFQGDVITMPMISFLDKSMDLGLSLVLSVEDVMLDVDLNTTKDGGVNFSRYNHRLGGNKVVEFGMDIVAHQADWRDGYGWVANRYKEYFMPVNPLAQKIAGTGAYSNSDVDFDVEKMHKMAFGINWRASFDFPYMGMFIPPVKDDEKWMSFVREREQNIEKRKITSIETMQNYCKKMDDDDFHVLNYFNVTEFGTLIEYPRPKSKRKAGQPEWIDANDYLYDHLADAMLFAPEKQKAVDDKGIYSSYPNKPFFTWEKAVVLDPGVKSFSDHLVAQAERSVKMLPNSYGICIDRMDWTRFYNHKTDDGISWMGGQAVGSQNISWNSIMSKLHPIFHDNNKVIFVNNHVKRIDQLRYVDGILDEFTYAGSPINTIGLMCTHKPALGWMSSDDQLKPDPDKVMQKYLYMGIFPMCPFPGNDHSMRPSDYADEVYLDYGALFKLLMGKEWVLKPHVIAINKGKANVNLFKTFDGYTIPIVNSNDKIVEVAINDKEIADGGYKAFAHYPGVDEKPVAINATVKDGVLTLAAPIKRSCAMVTLSK